MRAGYVPPQAHGGNCKGARGRSAGFPKNQVATSGSKTPFGVERVENMPVNHLLRDSGREVFGVGVKAALTQRGIKELSLALELAAMDPGLRVHLYPAYWIANCFQGHRKSGCATSPETCNNHQNWRYG